ncbi:MAG: hypothetical protein GWP61_14875 [Chloroflexi bacterium]|nr:hypothetical protein [Chloroflexota bacterium]
MQYAQLRKHRRGWRVSFLYSIIRLGSRQLIRTALKWSHQSLTMPIRRPSKRRYRTPMMAANLVRRRWSVQDLLQLPVPEGIWFDAFSATKGCR